MVLRTAMLLLERCQPESPDLLWRAYRFSEGYDNEAWFLTYQADVRMRPEELERIRRRLRAEVMLSGVPYPR
eukprot:8053819-Alexandrium_andersonii.AAC.1